MTRTRHLGPLLLAATLAGCAAAKPGTLGVLDGKLASCPAMPGCASTQAKSASIAPTKFTGSREDASRRLGEIVRAMPGAKVLTQAPDYLRAEFTTTGMFRHVDDVEIFLDARSRQVEFRSASRSGVFDFGANRKRIEAIRAKFLGAEAGAEKSAG